MEKKYARVGIKKKRFLRRNLRVKVKLLVSAHIYIKEMVALA